MISCILKPNPSFKAKIKSLSVVNPTNADFNKLIATEVIVMKTTFVLWMEEEKGSLPEQADSQKQLLQGMNSPIHFINIINSGSLLCQLSC